MEAQPGQEETQSATAKRRSNMSPRLRGPGQPQRRSPRGRRRGIGNITAGLLAAGLGVLGEWLGATGREVRRLRGHRASQVEVRRGRKY